MSEEERLLRRLERERRARAEAETIAEGVTRELYTSQRDLQRANEELHSLNESLREFVAIASHDLRGPLTSILGLSAMLNEQPDRFSPEQHVEFIAIIHRNSAHLARMVEDLLTVSRIEAGALDARCERVALIDAVERVIADFGARQAEVRVGVADAAALVDPDHLRRILANYVGNAFKYGAPPILVEVREDGAFVELRVRDHGEGVPEDLVPRLFGKFARGDAARAKGGTGLGLSIVRGLAQANGGEAWYEPNRPSGSCFGIRLPKPA